MPRLLIYILQGAAEERNCSAVRRMEIAAKWLVCKQSDDVDKWNTCFWDHNIPPSFKISFFIKLTVHWRIWSILSNVYAGCHIFEAFAVLHVGRLYLLHKILMLDIFYYHTNGNVTVYFEHCRLFCVHTIWRKCFEMYKGAWRLILILLPTT